MKTLSIYIPVAGTPLANEIAAGSGVVGFERDGMLILYYEGNLYGAENLIEYEHRVRCAADRCFTKYPTVARTARPADTQEVVKVGEISREDEDSFSYHIEITDHEAIDSYSKGVA